MRLNTGEVISDRYEVQELLGSGGMAVVYRALDLKLDRSVTLKVMRDELEADYIDRFYKEAQSVASLSHPNIVRVFDYGEDDGIHYIVMEYIDGSTLKELIQNKAPFDEETTLGVAMQIADGLLYAHNNDIVHRDIKSQNILVTHDGEVKIADFGIARVAKVSTLTSDASSMGSVHYFSPEQARGGFVDNKSDIYSLGITMYEMATGELPYDGETAVTVALKHINNPFPNPQDSFPETSDKLRYIILKAVEKSAVKRYQSAEDMLYDMKRALDDEEFSKPIQLAAVEESPTVEMSQDEQDAIRQQRRIPPGTIRLDDERSNRRLFVAAGVVALTLIIIITAGFMILFDNLRQEAIAAPVVTGMYFESAEAITEPLGLEIYMLGYDFSDDYSYGMIMHQSPAPDVPMAAGEGVFVTISRGPEFVPMPDVIHSLAEVAYERLSDLNLIVEMMDYDDVNSPAGIVVRTSPRVGELVSRDGGSVMLYISLGPDNSLFPMPFLIGLTEYEAIELLQEMGLPVGNVDHVPGGFFPEGTITNQQPESGELVQAGQVVSFTLASGTTQPDAAPQPTPSPTPEPETTPEPEQNPEPEYEYTPDEPTEEEPPPPQVERPLVRSSLSINLWDVPEGTESVTLRVWQRNEEGEQTLIVNYAVSVASFPLTIPVYGRGTEEFLVFSVEDGTEQPRSRTTYNFGS